MRPFIDFIWKEPGNRLFLLIALVGSLLEFILFKFLYPYPDFFSDSYSYIYVASAHLDIGIWPIGYSKFLALFHAITHSDTALVAFQYFFLEVAALYFFFTLLYFYRLSKATSIVLFVSLFFNPLFLYICNYVNSDPLFAALSLLWLTELLWIIQRPRPYQVFTQAVLLFLAFTVRYNALYYPIIGALAFVLSRHTFRIKIAGALLGILLIGAFIIHSRNEANKLTGTRQFSLFSGWQLANNALYIYDKISVDSAELPSAQSRELDRFSKHFYKHAIPGIYEALSSYTGNFFFRRPESPLIRYMYSHYRFSNEYGGIIAWGRSSAVFSEYGSYILKHHPVAFVRYFALMNAKNYFVPPLEKLEVYNLGEDKVWPVAQRWFDYKTPVVTCASKDVQGSILFLYPAIFLIVNLYLIGLVVWYVVSKKYKLATRKFNFTILLTVAFLVMNFLFCITATILVFRYEFFPMIICLSFSLLLSEVFELKTAPAGRSRLLSSAG